MRPYRHALGGLAALWMCTAAAAPTEPLPAVLPSHERVLVENRILNDRLEHLLPALMAEAHLDLWLVLNREYAEDPVYFTLVPQPTYAARRTTMLVFARRPDGTVERLAVNRYPLGDPYTSAWSGGDLAAQWQALADTIVSRHPQRIGINVSATWPEADGLSASLRDRLQQVLPPEYAGRLVSSEDLVVRWFETRTAEERRLYPDLGRMTRGVIAEAFSRRVITPGETTTADVAWYIRERFEQLGLKPWFMPTVDRQRHGAPCAPGVPHCGEEGRIEVGDVLHTDVGFCYLTLCTDVQEMGYVLRPGERDAPLGLRAALATGNRWQELLAEAFQSGHTGNEILADVRRTAAAAGIESWTYSHPLGYVGHAPGPTIGMWDNQGPTPGTGDWPLHDSTTYAIEGGVRVALPEWDGEPLQVMLEEDGLYADGHLSFFAGRQTEWHLID
jgi:Xaa-Pro aminopeptidase